MRNLPKRLPKFNMKPDRPWSDHFERQGLQVNRQIGIVKAAKGNGWLIVKLPSQMPVDGYYFDKANAIATARHWSSKSYREWLTVRLSRCMLYQHPKAVNGWALMW